MKLGELNPWGEIMGNGDFHRTGNLEWVEHVTYTWLPGRMFHVTCPAKIYISSPYTLRRREATRPPLDFCRHGLLKNRYGPHTHRISQTALTDSDP